MNSWSDTLLLFGLIAVELAILFLVISFLVVLINRKIGEERLKAWLAGGRLTAPLKGLVLGMLTPFCSCSTLPMLIGMLKAGAPFAGAAAFLIASPLLNPVILVIIALLFSWQIMLGYAAVTIVGALLVAVTWDLLGLERYVKKVRVEGSWNSEEPWRGFKAEARPAWSQALSGFRPLVIPMLIGVAIGALIYGAVPESFLVQVAGPGNWWAVPVAALIAMPLYIRTEAALPVGLALSSAGMGIGPIFAMIIAGAGASPPEVSMLAAIFKPPLVITFVGSVLAVAIAGGLVIPLFV